MVVKDIVIRIAGDSDEEVKKEDDDVTEPVLHMSYEAMCDHLKTKCQHVIVQCNSCNKKLRRNEFREHICFLALREIEHDVVENQKSEILQIFLEIHKLNKFGINLYKCF